MLTHLHPRLSPIDYQKGIIFVEANQNQLAQVKPQKYEDSDERNETMVAFLVMLQQFLINHIIRYKADWGLRFTSGPALYLTTTYTLQAKMKIKKKKEK